MVPYLNERFPTEIRATASAFCYHQAAIFVGFVPLILTASAEYFGTDLAEPMIVPLPKRRRSLHRSSVLSSPEILAASCMPVPVNQYKDTSARTVCYPQPAQEVALSNQYRVCSSVQPGTAKRAGVVTPWLGRTTTR
jgi:hypothetical protein